MRKANPGLTKRNFTIYVLIISTNACFQLLLITGVIYLKLWMYSLKELNDLALSWFRHLIYHRKLITFDHETISCRDIFKQKIVNLGPSYDRTTYMQVILLENSCLKGKVDTFFFRLFCGENHFDPHSMQMVHFSFELVELNRVSKNFI